MKIEKTKDNYVVTSGRNRMVVGFDGVVYESTIPPAGATYRKMRAAVASFECKQK